MIYFLQQNNIIRKSVEVISLLRKVSLPLGLREPYKISGTYFSLPEWYNPAYVKYGGNTFGIYPTNPYTNASIPYTGYVEVDDFVLDIQVPQMEQLAYVYDTELMWCDIGGANNMTIVASEWLNWARERGRQVTFNNRCGLTGDFDTPE